MCAPAPTKITSRSLSLQETCPVCFDSFPVKKMYACLSNHHFCQGCWQGYVAAAISDGPSVLNLRCPLPDCKAAVRGLATQFPNELQQQSNTKLVNIQHGHAFAWHDCLCLCLMPTLSAGIENVVSGVGLTAIHIMRSAHSKW